MNGVLLATGCPNPNVYILIFLTLINKKNFRLEHLWPGFTKFLLMPHHDFGRDCTYAPSGGDLEKQFTTLVFLSGSNASYYTPAVEESSSKILGCIK